MGQIVTDHEGKAFKSKKEMCETYGINCSTYYTRMERGWTQEEALTVPAKKIFHQE